MRNRSVVWECLMLAGILFPDAYNRFVLPAVIGSHVFDARADWLLPIISITVWTVSAGLLFAGFIVVSVESLGDLAHVVRVEWRKRRQLRNA